MIIAIILSCISILFFLAAAILSIFKLIWLYR
jgi:hypothetical protein